MSAKWNGKTIQVKDGQVHLYRIRKDGTAIVFTRCCDCGLTHLEEFTPKQTHIVVRVWRAEELTKLARKKKK